MKPIDLSKLLKQYTSGWVAIDQKKMGVMAHAKTFAAVCAKVKKTEDVLLIPASKHYFGFVTGTHG